MAAGRINNSIHLGTRPKTFKAHTGNETGRRQGFIDWCKDNSIDPLKKEHGIGLLPIGKVETINIEHLTKDSKANIIVERN